VPQRSVTSIEPVLSGIMQYHPNADTAMIERAYEFAEECHRGVLRASGEPYIVHPLSVAFIMTQLRSDENCVTAALVHDVVEDCGVSLEAIEERFGAPVRDLVDGVTKLSRIEFSTRREAQASGFRRLLLAMARDIRVIVLKLADRLHNMRTIDALAPAKQLDTATETLQIFAPLAERLGVWRVKWELEDLCLRVMDPGAYRMIEERVSRTRQDRLADVEHAMSIIKPRFEQAKVAAEVYGRAKHFYSIYLKMVRQGLDFDEIHDLLALRVLVETIPDCYAALGVVHECWAPIPDMFTDFIARPKSNQYRSLHTKVVGPRGESLEVQIRTHQMHQASEYGVAAHWLYKERDGRAHQTEFDRRLSWLRQLIDLSADLQDANQYLRALKDDLLRHEVFVFTPKGDLVELPAGSTPVDFAYHVHSDVGNRCVGAKVNGKMTPLSTPLATGQIVQVITQHNSHPSLDWLNFVRTPSARAKIRAYFRKLTFEENFNRGRELLEEGAAHRFGPDWATVATPERIETIAHESNFHAVDRFYAALGFREMSVDGVLSRVEAMVQEERLRSVEGLDLLVRKPARKRRKGPQIIAEGVEGLEFRLSKCCDPLPGDEIVGYVTRGKGLAVHRRSCHNAHGLMAREPQRILRAQWDGVDSDAAYAARVELAAIDRVGLLHDITSIVSDVGVNISQASVKTAAGKRCSIDVTFEVADAHQVDRLVDRLGRLSDVLRVRRIPR